MAQNNIEEFEKMDACCWEQPANHALVKFNWNGLELYEIYTLKPQLMMKLVNDINYAKRLANKMIESGVKVFEDSQSFDDWYKTLE